MSATDTIGGRIRHARQMRGMTQAQLAALVGVRRFYVSDWERGIRTPRPVLMKKVADALGVTARWLRTGEHGGE